MRESKGLIDCMVCLDAQFSMFVDTVPEEERELAWVLLKNVSKAEYKGIAKDQLLVSVVIYSICFPGYMLVLLLGRSRRI
jgi:hypothetical protein